MNHDFEEFYAYAEEILNHPIFLTQKHYFHHTTNLYEHSILVAYYSFKVAKKFNLDRRSIVRGALLHDFFLYDWHVEGKKRKYPILKKHGFTHAQRSLINANFYFALNSKEKDIIKKHMFPLNMFIPTTLESWVVNIVDDALTYLEYFKEDIKSFKILTYIKTRKVL